jgi:hypothetical protein
MSARRDVLDRRSLNRALLERQLLSRRRPVPPAAVIERLVGLQAQNPIDPYVALWSRIEGFRPERLATLIAERRAVRMPLLRGTIHLVTSDDAVTLRPVLQRALERAFFTGSPFGRRLAGRDVDEVTAAGRFLLEERPRTRADLRRLLGELWPGRDKEAMAMAVTYLLPVVQVPPRGLWGRSGQATWAPAEAWLARQLEGLGDVVPVIERYLRAFGPASVADVQAWSGLTRLREVIEGIRPNLRMFADEHGRELFDVPGAPRPDPETPAPVRFLPVYDNAYLGHADRARIVDADDRRRTLAADVADAPLLIDGFIRATWRLVRGDRAATIEVTPFRRLSGGEADDVSREGDRLLGFLEPEASRGPVRLVQPP